MVAGHTRIPTGSSRYRVANSPYAIKLETVPTKQLCQRKIIFSGLGSYRTAYNIIEKKANANKDTTPLRNKEKRNFKTLFLLIKKLNKNKTKKDTIQTKVVKPLTCKTSEKKFLGLTQNKIEPTNQDVKNERKLDIKNT
ncbi:hypothetical protein [Acetobacter pasteurianus]|uniref:hypothetical protein n=1 Tax=Acetobacter pasteurianus TaxID=438 RepID=UPI0013637021|nr:hypothetical protein [Acetobacter pasteurianus]QHM92171.1 hypothetical protein FCN51_11765 [Acetobacter pasteurianus]